ncbi:MAG: hypothetical protein Q8R33_17530 [Burkholderiales bacterium]|nr:hypothetical protein [Burkholderiales bacterium]
MSSSLIIALEFTLVIGVVLGLGVWELWSLRRDKRKDDAAVAPPRRKP